MPFEPYDFHLLLGEFSQGHVSKFENDTAFIDILHTYLVHVVIMSRNCARCTWFVHSLYTVLQLSCNLRTRFAQAVLSEIDHGNVLRDRFLKMGSPGRGDCTAIKRQISQNGFPQQGRLESVQRVRLLKMASPNRGGSTASKKRMWPKPRNNPTNNSSVRLPRATNNSDEDWIHAHYKYKENSNT